MLHKIQKKNVDVTRKAWKNKYVHCPFLTVPLSIKTLEYKIEVLLQRLFSLLNLYLTCNRLPLFTCRRSSTTTASTMPLVSNTTSCCFCEFWELSIRPAERSLTLTLSPCFLEMTVMRRASVSNCDVLMRVMRGLRGQIMGGGQFV